MTGVASGAGDARTMAEALCLGAHGVVRATEDVDVLISREGLDRFKERWLPRGRQRLRRIVPDPFVAAKYDKLWQTAQHPDDDY